MTWQLIGYNNTGKVCLYYSNLYLRWPGPSLYSQVLGSTKRQIILENRLALGTVSCLHEHAPTDVLDGVDTVLCASVS